jgi:hypothetical protein
MAGLPILRAATGGRPYIFACQNFKTLKASSTENFSVISRNYSRKQNTNLSPKEGTESKDEFKVSFFKLMSFSVPSVVWWWFWGAFFR